MKTKKERLEQRLKNAIASKNKSKAAWAIVEMERLDVTTPLEQGEVFCLMNADCNLVFGYYEIEEATEKAIKINNVWLPRKGIVTTIFEETEVIRLRHWLEETLTQQDFKNLDQDNLVINSLQIDKTKQEKIEVPLLKKEKEDSIVMKVFFVKVSESLVRIRKCVIKDYVILENMNWLTGSKEAKGLYNRLHNQLDYQLSKTKFADY